ncbi:FAD-dependent oxidoreductase [Nocardioides bruguierae]|uniref:ferredoxin--NADP(+) reductase n=1 Tax=Nocardioides bruguierae TaxID=2945102 RepID=A0A9X2IGZ3_9ACTN|nr:FAD-dependent oxidoreductase [Nocardioides bruguierae]MCM0622074.1 FAD-dependent oxidoreductase [Nocardioides bruguierae]
MPYVVTRACCADASCVVACPVNCLHPAPGEPGFAEAEMLHVDPDACVGCGACATACPVDAIKPHTRLSLAEMPFLEANAAYFETNPHPDRTPVARVPEQRRLRSGRPVRVAVVGAGPAGLYAADDLLRHPEVSVDVLDRLPTPHGLVRAGVAPDHPDTKRVQRLFERIESQPGFRYLLGVSVGTDEDVAAERADVSAAELREHYDAVVWAVGAASDKRLGIPGEDLDGSVSATELVGWYNGHPDLVDLPVDLASPRGGPGEEPDDGSRRAVVVGTGNVALDVARVLTADPARLRATDVAGLAWAELASSTVTEVVVLGRRGPAEAAFSLPEILGLEALAAPEDGIDVLLETGAWPLPAADTPRGRALARLAAARPRGPLPDGRPRRRVVLRTGAVPVAVLGEERVRAVEVETTRPAADGRPLPTGEVALLPARLLVRAVGWFGRPVADLPHDEETGAVVHEDGSVAARPQDFVVGWAKRGPRGTIGANKACAQETVSSLLDHLDAVTHRVAGAAGLDDLLADRGVEVVDLAGWRAIDAEERRRGQAAGRARCKVVEPEEMLRLARRAASAPAHREGLLGRYARRRRRSVPTG